MPGFKSDANVSKTAEACSLDALEIANRSFKVALNWSDTSIESIEQMLYTMHEQIGDATPDDNQIWFFARAFGSYVGEVYRKHHGGAWGIVQFGADEFPGMLTDSGIEFWPWGRVYQRLVKGPENNVWHYYQRLLASA